MSAVGVTFRRTLGMVSGLYITALSIAGFLAASAALFAFNLDAGEGGLSSLASLWAVSVSPILPILAALVGMEVWSDELKTGRIDLLLSSPVSERDFVKGKFWGVWMLSMVALLISLVSAFVFLDFYAPSFFDGSSLWGFIPAFILLVFQGALWSAVAVMASALFRNAAGAAAMTIFAIVAFPRVIWLALSHWTRGGRIVLGDFPLDAHAFDFASGLFGVGTLLSYAILTFFVLFAAARIVALRRFSGRRLRLQRFSLGLSVVLGFALSFLAISLAGRMDLALDMPVAGSGETRFSPGTREILSRAHGSIAITVFLERTDPQFRHVSHFLRSLKREADSTGGVALEIKYVDPVLDTGEALRLVRAGVEKASLVFERGERIAHVLKIADGYGERECMALIERMASPLIRSTVYWTFGHGEASFSNYAFDGLSDIARNLSLDGYEHKAVNLADPTSQIGSDSALLIVAGARTDFSAREIERLGAYLEGQSDSNGGGRLLVLADGALTRGMENLLSRWGILAENINPAQFPTASGSDVVASQFSANHPVSRPFNGYQVVLEKPVAFKPSAMAIEGLAGADRKKYSDLLSSGKASFAAAVERGGKGEDLAIRPTRIVAIGDVGFVLNGKLRSSANANRDFFLNAVKYLSGRDSLPMSGSEVSRLVTGMTRSDRASFAMASALGFPVAFFAIHALLIARRRRRK